MRIFKNKITFTGLNLSRAIQQIEEMEVELFDVKKMDAKTMTFCTYAKDCSKVVAYLKKKCYNILNIDKVGSYLLFSHLKSHCISILLLILSIFALCMIGAICTKVVVYGPTDLLDRAYQAVSDYGEIKGSFKKNLSLDGIENALCVALPEVKYAFATFKGSHLIIRLEPRTIADQPIDNATPQDLIATGDGTVLRMVVINGTPQVSVGDTVKKGQVLIKGETTYADGTTQSVKALGQVWATYQISANVKFTPTKITLVSTGSQFKRYRIQIGNYTSAYSKTIDYAYFSADTTLALLYPLGIKIEYQTVYEMHPVEQRLQLNDCLVDLQTQAFEQLKQKLNGVEYDSVEYGVQTINDDVFVTATATITQNIAIGG